MLAARLCLVGSKVGARVQSLGNVLEAHAITAGRRAGLCGHAGGGRSQVRRQWGLELVLYLSITATAVELVECLSEDLC